MKLLLLSLLGLAAADNWPVQNGYGNVGINKNLGGFNGGFGVKQNPFGVNRGFSPIHPGTAPTKVVQPGVHNNGHHGIPGGYGFGGPNTGTVFNQKKGPVVSGCYGPHCNNNNVGYGNNFGRGGHGVGHGVGSGYGNTGNVGHGVGGGYGGNGIGIGGVGGYGVRKPVANRGCPNPNGYGYQRIVNPCGYGKFCAPQGYGRICCPAPTCALQGYRVSQNRLPIAVLTGLVVDNNLNDAIISGLETAAAGDAASGDVWADSNDVFLGTSGASLYPDDCCNICWRDSSCRGVSYLFVTKNDHKSFAVCVYLKGFGKNSYEVDTYYYKSQFNQNSGTTAAGTPINDLGLKFACLTATKATAVSHNPHGIGFGHTSTSSHHLG